MDLICGLAGFQIRVILVILALLALLHGLAEAQESEPLLGYLLAAEGKSWGVGGDLGVICPPQLSLPSGREPRFAREIYLSGIYADYYRRSALEIPDTCFSQGLHGSVFISGSVPVIWEVYACSKEQLWRISLFEEQNDQFLNIDYDRWVTSL